MIDPKLKQYEYYRTELGVLYCGDCLTIMPMLEQVDLVLTDPPYGLDKKWSGGTWFTRGVYKSNVSWDKKQPEAVSFLVSLNVPSIIWGGVHYELPPARCHLAWVKTNNVPTMADFELAWTNLDRPSKKFDRPCNGWRRTHPTEKPLDLIIWCLDFLPNQGIVIDSFVGSGTTIVACERYGRRWVGIEGDEEKCDVAAKRIERERQQLKLFPPKQETPKPKQEALF